MWTSLLSPSVEGTRDSKGEEVELVGASRGMYMCRCNRSVNFLSPCAGYRGRPRGLIA